MPDRVMLLADMKVLQWITDSLGDWLDEWKAKSPSRGAHDVGWRADHGEHLVRDVDQGIHLGHLVAAHSHRSCDLLLKATRAGYYIRAQGIYAANPDMAVELAALQRGYTPPGLAAAQITDTIGGFISESAGKEIKSFGA